MKTFDRLFWQRQRRKLNNNAYTKKYEKTPKGFLMRLYRNMQSRTSGVQKIKFHLYKGKFLLSREDFYSWSLQNPDFLLLLSQWKLSNFQRRLCPSVDRIDSTRGYETGNMRWVTFSENCKHTSKNKTYEI